MTPEATAMTLRQETQDEIARQMQFGGYATADDVVAAGLRLLDQSRVRSEVRAKIAAGQVSADRGEVRDGAVVFRELFARIEAAAAADATPAEVAGGRP